MNVWGNADELSRHSSACSWNVALPFSHLPWGPWHPQTAGSFCFLCLYGLCGDTGLGSLKVPAASDTITLS